MLREDVTLEGISNEIRSWWNVLMKGNNEIVVCGGRALFAVFGYRGTQIKFWSTG